MESNGNNSIKTILLLMITALIILGVLGSVYYMAQSSGRILFIKAEEKFRLGTTEDIRNGIQLFRVMAEKYPKSPYASRALFQIGYGYELMYKITRDESKLNIAEQEYQNVHQKYPESMEAQKALARIAHISYLKGNYEDAQERLDYILSRYLNTPLKGEIYTEKGYIALASGEVKRALKFFSQKENVNQDRALLGKAEAYFKLGEYAKGLDIYEDFIAYRKTSNQRRAAIDRFLNNCYDYARKLTKEKDYKYSNLLFEKIVSLFPDHKLSENALYWLGENYYDQKEYGKSIPVFKKVLNNKFTHKDDSALFKLGICYFDNAQFEESLKYFQNLLDNYPRSAYYKNAADWKRQVLREIKYRH